MINHRLSWLITGESIFLGFYVSSATNPVMVAHANTLGRAAFFTCIAIYASVLAAVVNLSLLRRQLDRFCEFEDCDRLRPIPNVSPSHWPIRYAGLIAPIVIPIVFIIAWTNLIPLKTLFGQH